MAIAATLKPHHGNRWKIFNGLRSEDITIQLAFGNGLTQDKGETTGEMADPDERRVIEPHSTTLGVLMPTLEAAPLGTESGNGVNRHAVHLLVVDLDEPEGEAKWGFVSGSEAGLLHRHDSLPKSKESQIRALEGGRHQHGSSPQV